MAWIRSLRSPRHILTGERKESYAKEQDATNSRLLDETDRRLLEETRERYERAEDEYIALRGKVDRRRSQ